MKKIGLVYAYSGKNAGDLAITLGALDLLSSTGSKITTISRYSSHDKQFTESAEYIKKRYPNVEILSSPFELNRDCSKINLLRQYVVGLFKILGIINNQHLKNTILGFDKLYFNGGNLLRCESVADFIRLVALVYPIKVALKSNIPVVVLPQSTAKINWFGQMLLKPILNSVERVFCREEMSYLALKNYFPKAPLSLNTDLAFCINYPTLKISSNIKRIAITTRSQTIGDLKDLPESSKRKIEHQLKILTDQLLKDGYLVSFVVQTEKDLAFTKNIYNLFENNTNVSLYENYDPLDLIQFYSTCNLLVGMRLHSIILALSAGTPCVGYFDKSWGLKNPGILKSFDQGYVFIEDDDRALLSLIDAKLGQCPSANKENVFLKIQKFRDELILDE